MYNRRPNITKYKTYDKIYFIAPNPNDVIEDIEKLENLLPICYLSQLIFRSSEDGFSSDTFHD